MREEGIRPPDDPRFPPYSVTRPAVRRSAVITYVGGITLLFVVVGFGMLYWMTRDKDRVDPSMPQAVGTVGSAQGGHQGSPGGSDPEKRPNSTRDEIERRGGTGAAQGSTPALREGAALTEIGDLFKQPPAAVAGQPVDVRDAEVESGDGAAFWIRDGDARVAVVAAAASVRVSPGNKVDVKGVAEPDGRGGVRVRAQQVQTR